MTLTGKWPDYDAEMVAAVGDVLSSGKVNYWTGSQCKAFEKEFATFCDAEHAISLANGTVALELALEACGIGPGDEVIVTPRTFIASASCVVRLGARPVFADIDVDTQNITPETAAKVISGNTRAIIPVHHAGWPCDMDGFSRLAESHDLIIIEDCAQAHGAAIRQRPVGSFGHMAAFSFCQDKVMTTGGEGGMLVTSDESLWKRAWSIKDHGKNYDAVFNKKHEPGFRWLHESFGTNMRMTEMQAVIGRVQLARMPDWHARRNEIANALMAAMRDYSCIRLPRPGEEIAHAYYRLYAFIVPGRIAPGWSRDKIVESLVSRGIPCFSGSCPEIYNERAFEEGELRPETPLPVAQSLGPLSLAFLVHPTLTNSDVQLMIDAIGQVMSSASK